MDPEDFSDIKPVPGPIAHDAPPPDGRPAELDEDAGMASIRADVARPKDEFADIPAVSAVPDAFIERMRKSNTAVRMITDIGSAEIAGAKEGFGDQPLGIEHDSEFGKWLTKYGIFNDPSSPKPALDILRFGPEEATRGVFLGLELAGRTFEAANRASALGAEKLGQLLMGGTGEDHGLADDLTVMGDLAGLLDGGNVTRIAHGPMSEIRGEPLAKGLPTGPDFENAAKYASDGRGDPGPMTAKLQELWQKHGILPSEAAADAKADPLVAQALVSKSSDLPARYTGAREAGTAAEDLRAPASNSAVDLSKFFRQFTTDELQTALAKARNRQDDLFPNSPYDSANPFYEAKRMAELIERHLRQRSAGQPWAQGPSGAREAEAATEAVTEDETGAPLGEALGRMTPRRPTEPPAPPGGGGGKGGEPPEPPKPGSYEEARDNILDHLSIGEKDAKDSGYSLDKLYTDTVDKLFPIAKAVKEAGVDLKPSDNPYVLGRLFAGWAGKADVMLNHYTFDFGTHQKTGESLRDVLAPVKDQLNDFRAFAAASRARELDRRGIKTGFDAYDVQRVGDNRTKLFSDTMLKLVDYQNRVAGYLRDSGVLSTKGYTEMLAANKLYVPFHVILQEKGLGISRVGETLQASNPIKAIKGSDLAKVDPLETIVKNTHLMVANADRNNIGTKLIDLLLDNAKGPTGKELTVVPQARGPREAAMSEAIRSAEGQVVKFFGTGAGRGRGGSAGIPSELTDFLMEASHEARPGEISIFRDGKRETYLVDPELAAAYKNLNVSTAGMIDKWLRPLAASLRAGAVLAPDFALRHMVRDFAYAFSTYTGEGTFHPLDMGRGLLGMIMKGRDPDFVEWMRDGGGQVAMVALDRNYLQENLEQLTRQTGLFTRSWNVVRNGDFKAMGRAGISPFQFLNEVATSATHLGAYKKRVAEIGGAIDKARAVDAAYTSRTTAVDAHRMGAKMAAYNSISAFANIKVQDFDRIVRAFKDDPVNTGLKIGAAITLPSILLWEANRDDKRVQDLPNWEKDAFYIIPIGDTIFRLPKPFSAGVAFGSLAERMLDAYVKEKPDAFKGFLADFAEQSVGEVFPTAIIPGLEQANNRSFMSGHTLIPANMEEGLPEYQYTQYTTETAKALGKIFAAFPGIREARVDKASPYLGGAARALSSPILIENYWRGWTGTLGQYALRIIDKGLREAGMVPDPPHAESQGLTDVPVIRAFMVRYPGPSQTVQDFYDKYSTAKEYQDTFDRLRKQGDVASMESIRAAGGEDAFVKLDGIKKSLGLQSAAIRNINKLPEAQMTKGAKRQLIDSLMYGMVRTAGYGNDAMSLIEKNLKENSK